MTNRISRQYSPRLTLGILGLPLLIQVAPAQEKVTYQDQVLPLVENNCGKCHNPDNKKADLDLTTYTGVMKGSGSGPVVVSGNLDGSKLWRAITQVEEPTMPPNKPKLPDKELEIFRKWIVGGLLETTGSKAVAAAKPAVDFTLKAGSTDKPDGPPPMPQDLPLETPVHTVRRNPLIGLAASPWAPLISAAGQKQVLLYHSETLQLLGILPFTEGQPADVKFSRNGTLLLAGGGRPGKSGRVVVWNVITGERLMTIGDEYDTVLAADIRPDQTQIALGGPGRLVKIYSTKTGELLHKKKKHTDWVNAIAFSPNGALLASGDRNGGITIWDPDNGQELFTLAGHKSSVTALSWRGDSKLLASCSEDGAIKLWEMQDGKQAKTWEAHKGGALSVSYTHDGRMVSCGRDNQTTLWNPDGGKARSVKFSGELPLRAVFSHDGSRVFTTDFAGELAAWNAADGKSVGQLDPNPLPLADQLAAAEKKVAELLPTAHQAASTEQQAALPSDTPSAALNAAHTTVKKIKAAQVQTSVYRLRESIAARKREQEKFLALATEKQNEIKKVTDQLKAATDNSAQMKLQAALKDLTAEGRSAEAAAKRAGADLLTEQSRLERLSAEYQRIKTASLSTTSEHLVH